MQFRRVLTVGVALTFVVGVLPAPAQQQRNNNQRQPQRSKAEQQDIETLVRLIDGVGTGQPAPAEIPITWESNHFVKGQGGITYIPYTLSVDRSKMSSRNVAMYVRMIDKKQASQAAAVPAASKDGNNKNQRNEKGDQAAPAPRPTYAWDNLQFIEIPSEGKLSRAVALPPGDYDAYIAIKEKGTEQKNAPPAKIGVFHRELTVPDFNVAALTTSSVILATAVEPQTATLSPAQQEENPYVFGPMKIVPSADGKFVKTAELQVVFWIYGAVEGAGGKPDVQVEYNFYQRPADGAEKYFNKTAPQQLNAQTLPPEFSVAAGHQLPGSLVVPLTSFPSGEYRLEIKVTDKPSGKTVTQNVNFTVLMS